ncbi:hypothetical protein [Pseudomonas sp. NBRC 111124]|uniref:hypothetical protein n=1 Tax=Pseudomonas sp. NBRC 111124 TaxID=1661039 RepID=UPI000ADF032A|nr:hypothetical protein [Pseudomonas sp. NBRC 111124]
MTIEAETLAELTQALKAQGAKRVADLTFIRAPYRCDHRWVCNVVNRSRNR